MNHQIVAQDGKRHRTVKGCHGRFQHHEIQQQQVHAGSGQKKPIVAVSSMTVSGGNQNESTTASPTRKLVRTRSPRWKLGIASRVPAATMMPTIAAIQALIKA